MTTRLFDRAMCMTDMHFGLKYNSAQHNQDVIDFFNWFIAEAKTRNCDTCICLGDWHHHRSNISILTLDYTMRGLRLLNDNFKHTYILVGNHDLFYKERREVHAMVVGQEFPNITIVDDITVIGDVALVPWMVHEEWKTVKDIKAKYMFGHLELPGFYMNAMVKMPETGELSSAHLTAQDYVFSGHFHKRQNNGNIHYIGNPFGHNYSDVGDFDRGAMYLEWGCKPVYLNYEDGPRYNRVPLSQLVESPEVYLTPKMYIQVTVDTEITYEEAAYLKETFMEQYDIREFKLMQSGSNAEAEDVAVTTIQSVDQIVIEQLNAVESKTLDTNKLIEIYTHL